MPVLMLSYDQIFKTHHQIHKFTINGFEIK